MSQGAIYVLVGPDRFRKRQRLLALKDRLKPHPLDVHTVDASALPATELLALARAVPTASPRRFIVVDQAQRLAPSAVEALARMASAITETACLVLLVETELGQPHPCLALRDRAMVEPFGRLAPTEVSRWIHGEVTARKMRISPEAVNDLLLAYGSDLAGIFSVLERLMTGRGSHEPITQEQVRRVVDVPSGVGGFALVEALARRNAAGALQVIHEQLGAGKEPLELLGLIAWQLARWLLVRRMLDAGEPIQPFAERLGLKPWQAERLCAEVRDRPARWCRRALRQCWELDTAAKRGRVISRTALEQLAVGLCLPAPRNVRSTSARQAGLGSAVA